VGGVAALLSWRAWAALAALLAALALYDALAGELPNRGLAVDTAVLALVLIPATCAVVWMLLPLARTRGLLLVGLAAGVLAFTLYLAGVGSLFNVTKVIALALLGFWFLTLFLDLAWVALVAVIIPWVDAISVWRGPTDYVVSERPGLFERVSVGFRVPGEDATANLGPPDILFFALFLATAARFELRVAVTAIAMTALLSLTLVLSVVFDASGLPALPAVCLGFLLPNADLIWRRLRQQPRDSGTAIAP
jgi:hypothetical protein